MSRAVPIVSQSDSRLPLFLYDLFLSEILYSKKHNLFAYFYILPVFLVFVVLKVFYDI